MFDFINRFDTNSHIFFQWELSEAKKTFNSQEAIERWRWCDRFRKFTTKIYNKDISIQVPITDKDWVNVTSELKVFLYKAAKSKRIDDLLVRIRWEFLKVYDVYDVSWQILFKNREWEEWDYDDILFLMKQFIFGFWRMTPVLTKSWSIRRWEFEHYYDWNPKGDWFWDLTYHYRWKDYKTPLYGVYMPHMIETIFREEEPLPSGKYLQWRQKDFLWKMAKVNFLFASRRSGKSLLLQLIQFLMDKIERPKTWFKKMRINYFCQSTETFNEISDYMESFAEAYWLPYKRVPSKSILQYITYEDWKQKILWEVQFKSWLSVAKGLGGTPYAVIIDEASRQPEEVYKRALANVRLNNTLMFCLTTVNYESDRDWVYEEAMRSYFKAMEYEPMEDTVVRLRRKYWMDKIKTPQEAREKMADFWKMREEFLNERTYSCSFYTIDDIEYLTESQKEEAIEEDSHRWEKFILAEYFSVFADKKKVFQPYKLLDDDVPEKFNRIVFWFDQAEAYDNAALCVIWITEDRMYVIDSIILSEQFDVQIEQIKRLKNDYQRRLLNPTIPIRVAVDVTSKKSDVSSIELRWLKVDLPVYWTGGNSPHHFDKRVLKVSRNALFQTAQEAMDLQYVRFDKKVDSKKWLLEELASFVIKKWSYRTQSTKQHDDQVAAMLMALYYIYDIMGMKKDLFKRDTEMLKQSKMSEDEMIRQINKQMSQRNRKSSYSIINY